MTLEEQFDIISSHLSRDSSVSLFEKNGELLLLFILSGRQCFNDFPFENHFDGPPPDPRFEWAAYLRWSEGIRVCAEDSQVNTCAQLLGGGWGKGYAPGKGFSHDLGEGDGNEDVPLLRQEEDEDWTLEFFE